MCVGGVPYKKKEHVQANLSRPRLFVAFVSAENDAKGRNVALLIILFLRCRSIHKIYWRLGF